MSAPGPRKRVKKAVAAEVRTPQDEALTSPEEVKDADTDQAVAAAQASETQASPPGVEQQDSLVADAAGITSNQEKRCVRCGQPAVYVTDAHYTSPVAYCQRDLPANITPAMVNAYRVALA